MAFDLERECEWIRSYPMDDTNLILKYSLSTNFTRDGEKKTICEYERLWGPGSDPNEVADTFYSLVTKARENIKQLSEEHGFTEVLSVG